MDLYCYVGISSNWGVIIMISLFLSKIDGYKTYIVCAITIIYAVAGAILGYLTWVQATQMVLAALGAAGFRSAINRVGQ